MKTNELYVKFYVKNSYNKEEEKWAERIALKSYNFIVRKFMTPIFIPLYNKTWEFIKTRFNIVSKEESEFYEGMPLLYDKVYFRVFDFLVNLNVILSKGISIKEKKRIVIRTNFCLKPTEKESYYFVDNMIQIKRWGH